jgi:ABC-type molybdate transport system substrate-binding protein
MVGRASKPRAMKRLSFVAAMALAAFAAGPAAAADDPVVFAAASLREAFEAAAPVFTKQTGVR